MTEQTKGTKSGKTIEQLESLCEELSIRHKKLKDELKEISKLLKMVIDE